MVVVMANNLPPAIRGRLKLWFVEPRANVFVSAMAKYKSEVLIEFNGKEVNGKSIMNIMAACIKCGSEIEIRCIGEDEADALKEAVELVKSGLGDEN